MKKKRITKNRSAAEMSAALAALGHLDARVVERCPDAGCAVCGPAITKAA